MQSWTWADGREELEELMLAFMNGEFDVLVLLPLFIRCSLMPILH
jgi:hypothetical protein